MSTLEDAKSYSTNVIRLVKENVLDAATKENLIVPSVVAIRKQLLETPEEELLQEAILVFESIEQEQPKQLENPEVVTESILEDAPLETFSQEFYDAIVDNS